jgi:hypothetical protein
MEEQAKLANTATWKSPFPVFLEAPCSLCRLKMADAIAGEDMVQGFWAIILPSCQT